MNKYINSWEVSKEDNNGYSCCKYYQKYCNRGNGNNIVSLKSTNSIKKSI